jgi:hypothetical protein
VVSAEVFAVLRGLGALLVAGEDVSAELDHGVPLPLHFVSSLKNQELTDG